MKNNKLLSGIHCAGWKPIYTAASDTDRTEDQVVDHNEYGVESGCWESPK